MSICPGLGSMLGWLCCKRWLPLRGFSPFRYHQSGDFIAMTETEEIRWVKTHCARMDHGGCALLVGVRDNTIVQIKGDPQGYLNKGYLCYKGGVSAERLTH